MSSGLLSWPLVIYSTCDSPWKSQFRADHSSVEHLSCFHLPLIAKVLGMPYNFLYNLTTHYLWFSHVPPSISFLILLQIYGKIFTQIVLITPPGPLYADSSLSWTFCLIQQSMLAILWFVFCHSFSHYYVSSRYLFILRRHLSKPYVKCTLWKAMLVSKKL